MNFTKRLIVEPGSKVSLTDVDPDFHGDWKSVDDAQADLDKNLGRISQLQRKLYASRIIASLLFSRELTAPGRMAPAGT